MTEQEINEAIKAAAEMKKIEAEDNDDLDAYMENLSKTEKNHGGKGKISQLKKTLQSQQNELKRLEKLVNFAKPTEMPKLSESKPAGKSLIKSNQVLIGKRWGFGGSKNLRTVPVQPKEKVVQNPSKDERIPSTSQKVEHLHDSSENNADIPSEETSSDVISDKTRENKSDKPLSLADKRTDPDRSNLQEMSDDKQITEKDVNLQIPQAKKNRSKRKMSKNDNIDANDTKVPGNYDESDPKFATWIPPTNQTGDGRTSLNDKYGY